MSCIKEQVESERLMLQIECCESRERKAEAALRDERRLTQKLKDDIRHIKKRLNQCHTRAIAAEQAADRIKRGITDASNLEGDDAALMRELEKEGVFLRDIADKFETDLITVACVIEGVV